MPFPFGVKRLRWSCRNVTRASLFSSFLTWFGRRVVDLFWVILFFCRNHSPTQVAATFRLIGENLSLLLLRIDFSQCLTSHSPSTLFKTPSSLSRSRSLFPSEGTLHVNVLADTLPCHLFFFGLWQCQRSVPPIRDAPLGVTFETQAERQKAHVEHLATPSSSPIVLLVFSGDWRDQGVVDTSQKGLLHLLACPRGIAVSTVTGRKTLSTTNIRSWAFDTTSPFICSAFIFPNVHASFSDKFSLIFVSVGASPN